jgi:hypothetical protein
MPIPEPGNNRIPSSAGLACISERARRQIASVVFDFQFFELDNRCLLERPTRIYRCGVFSRPTHQKVLIVSIQLSVQGLDGSYAERRSDFIKAIKDRKYAACLDEVETPESRPALPTATAFSKC